MERKNGTAATSRAIVVATETFLPLFFLDSGPFLLSSGSSFVASRIARERRRLLHHEFLPKILPPVRANSAQSSAPERLTNLRPSQGAERPHVHGGRDLRPRAKQGIWARCSSERVQA